MVEKPLTPYASPIFRNHTEGERERERENWDAKKERGAPPYIG